MNNDNIRDRGEKACNVCGALIPVLAIYCKECSHYQSSFRRLISGIDISALTALISSTALAFTFLSVHFPSRYFQVVAVGLACDGTHFGLAAGNLGSTPAILTSVRATRAVNNIEDNQTFTLAPTAEADLIIKPADQRTLAFETKPNEKFASVPSGSSVCYVLEVEAKEFGQPEPTFQSAISNSHARKKGFVRCGSCA